MPYYPPRPENSAEATSFLAGGDVEAVTVQAAIAELSTEKARAGVNTDITSLGSLAQPVTIKGDLSIPNVSRFAAYNSIPENASEPNVAFPDTFNKVKLDQKLFDPLGEFSESRFTAKTGGVYMFNASVAVIRPSEGGIWRVIVTLFKNGVEIVRGNDLTMALPYGGSSVTGICSLASGDYIELYFYTNQVCRFYDGTAVTALRGVKVA